MWKEEEEKSKDLAKHFKEMALQKGVCTFVSLSASIKQIDGQNKNRIPMHNFNCFVFCVHEFEPNYFTIILILESKKSH